jgi:formate dehydrogenase
MKTVYTQCRICTPTCGIEVTVTDDNRVARIAPDKQNPYTWRDFCAKGRTAGQSLEHPRRLLSPMRRVADRYVEATWDEAISDIAARLREIKERYGPDAIGMYLGNPAYFSSSNALFAGAFLDAIGTRNRYSATSVDTNNWHVVAEAMYGSPFACHVPEVDECRCFLLVGMNPAVSAMGWLYNVPNGWRRVLAAQAKGADLIVVDPRRTATAEKANTHLAVRPGQDWALLLGILKVILENGWEHRQACGKLNGLDAIRQLAREADLSDLSRRCEISVDDIADVARRFAHASAAFCDSHTGVSQTPTGTLGEWFSHLLNLVTGRIDQPGGRRFERGYVSTIELWDRLAPPQTGTSRVRNLAPIAGYRAVAELADEIVTPGPGQIRALFVNSGNPVVTGPDGRKLDAAMGGLDLLVAIDLVQRESHRHAHWLIPDTHFLEREDLFALVSQLQELPFVQYASRAVDPPPNVREAWRFFTDLALAMDVPMFGKAGVNQFIKLTRAAAKRSKRPALAFNPRWISRLLVASGRRIKWKDILAHPHGWIYGEKEYGRFEHALKTPDKRVNAAPPEFLDEVRRQLAVEPPTSGSSFALISQRHRDTMNSWLGDLPGLRAKERHNDVEIHPSDAARLGVRTGDVVRVSSPTGSIDLPARVSDAVREGVVAIEQGWGSSVLDPVTGGKPDCFGANRNILVSSTDLDPLSQIPALNSQAVSVERISADSAGPVGDLELALEDPERGEDLRRVGTQRQAGPTD